jgi:tetratricopeptide (TPR) repeat protein
MELLDHFKTFELLYRCYQEIGNYSDARRCIEKAHSLNEKNDNNVAIEFASVLLNENNPEVLKKSLWRLSKEIQLMDLLNKNPTQLQDFLRLRRTAR